MNDAEAMAEINRQLWRWFDGREGALEVLNKIAQVTGANRMSK